MRILVATDSWFPDARGGSGRVATETSRRLAARGHDVTVLAPRRGGLPAVEVDGRLTLLRRLHRSLLPQTVADTVSARRESARLTGPFDLLVAHQVTVATGLSRALEDVPLVLVYHASAVREALLREQNRSSRARGWGDRAVAVALRRFERIATRRAGRVVVLSEYSRSLVTRDHPSAGDRVRVVRGGVDTQKFTPLPGKREARAAIGVDEAATLLVSIRRLERHLGLEAVVRAFGRVAPKQNLQLAIVGDGSLAPRLRELAGELRLLDRVRLVGVPADGELPHWYRAADLFVLPPAPHEGFGMATLEALSSGTPVVAAPVGANPELLSPVEPRLLARSASPEDIAAAITGALGLIGQDLCRRCRDYAEERFDWDRVIQDWEDELLDAAGIVE